MGHVACANNAWGNIAAAIGTSDTTISLTSGQGARFPSTANGDWFYLTLIDPTGVLEIVEVTGRNTDILTVTRGADGTAPHAFPAGSACELRPVAGWFKDFMNAFMARDGQYPATGTLDMAGHAILNIPDPTNATDPATKHYVDTSIAAALPVGIIMLWQSGTIPPNYHICDGTTGTIDLRDKFIVGAGNNYAALATGGAATVVLDITMVPSHNHAASSDSQGNHQHSATTNTVGDHQHTLPNYGSAQAGSDNGGVGIGVSNGYGTGNTQGPTGWAGGHNHVFNTDYGGTHAHNISVGYAGGGQAHENRPPYTALFYIQKVT